MDNVLVKGVSIGLLTAVLLVSIPCAALDASVFGSYVTTSTSVSGDAVMNQTTSIRYTTVSGGIEEENEWSSISIREGPLSERWSSSLLIGSSEEQPVSWFFQRTGSLGSLTLSDFLDRYH